jgi:hypothetical protein
MGCRIAVGDTYRQRLDKREGEGSGAFSAATAGSLNEINPYGIDNVVQLTGFILGKQVTAYCWKGVDDEIGDSGDGRSFDDPFGIFRHSGPSRS